MTRKDFNLIASTIKALDLGDSDEVYIATMFAEALATTNPNFDKTKFVKAAVPARLSPLFIADVQSAAQARVARLKEALAA